MLVPSSVGKIEPNRIHDELKSTVFTPLSWHNAIMRRNAKEILAIRCPTCGTKPSERYELSIGKPRNIPHRDRGVAAEDTQTILVIDDEASDREMMSETLRRDGYTVLEANAYQDALRVFARNGEIDLMVSDVSLPGGNGCELAMAIRKQKPDIRMLFVSGHVGAEECRFYGLELSDLHFLRKPFSATDLVSREMDSAFYTSLPRIEG